MKSVATPAIQGFDGSERIKSYFSRVVRRKFSRVIENDVHARIFQNVAVQATEKWSSANDSRFDFNAINSLYV